MRHIPGIIYIMSTTACCVIAHGFLFSDSYVLVYRINLVCDIVLSSCSQWSVVSSSCAQDTRVATAAGSMAMATHQLFPLSHFTSSSLVKNRSTTPTEQQTVRDYAEPRGQRRLQPYTAVLIQVRQHMQSITRLQVATSRRLQRSATVVAASRLARPLVTAGTSSRGLSSCCSLRRERHPVLSRSRAVNTAAVAVGAGRCFHSAPTTQRGGDGVEASAQSEASETRPSDAGEVRSPAVQEKWGWSSSTDRWYYPLKAMGVFSKKNTNALSSARMLQTCLNNAERQGWYSDGKISNEFLPKLLWLSTNVWLLSRRLLREGDRGKKVQELLFDELWRETKRQMRSIQVSEMMLKKYLSEAQQHTFVTLVQYDHAYTLESREERMEILMSALWRGVLMNNESIKESHVRVIAEYMDKELADVYEIDAEDFFAVCMEFAPPPPELKANKASKHLPKGGDKRSRNGKAVPTEARLEVPQEGATERVVVGGGGRDKFEHEDVGEGLKGRWRSCLAESGKAYYWHTKTREVTWDKPAQSEAFIPSIMPKIDQTAAA